MDIIVSVHTSQTYCISSATGQSLFPSKNNLKNLDPSYKMDLDLWDCF